MKCRDNFKELKASLHGSGRWRFGITDEYANKHPEIVPPSRDRAWTKWKPLLDEEHKLAMGFQIVCPQASLYLQPEHREKWDTSVVFVEPAAAESEMTVLSVCVVLGHVPISFTPNSRGLVVAVLPLGADRTVQVIVTHENIGDIPRIFRESFQKMLGQLGPTPEIPDEGVFFVHGSRGGGIPWVGAVPYKRITSRSSESGS